MLWSKDMRSQLESGFGATGAAVAVAIPMEIHLTSQKLWKRKSRAADGFCLMLPRKSGF